MGKRGRCRCGWRQGATFFLFFCSSLLFLFLFVFLRFSSSVVIFIFAILPFGKISTNGGLSPKFSEKVGQKSFRENRAFSGLIETFSGPIGAFLGLIGTDSSAHHSRGEAAEISPKGPFWAQLAPCGLSPRLLSPRLDFPNLWICRGFGVCRATSGSQY